MSHNIITRMSLVPVVVHPVELDAEETLKYEWTDADPNAPYPHIIHPFEPGTFYSLVIDDERDPIGDVTIDVRARANFNPPSSPEGAHLSVYVAGQQVALFLRSDGFQCPSSAQQRVVTFSAAQWIAMRAGASTLEVKIYGRFSRPDDCPNRQAEFFVEYNVARDEVLTRDYAYMTFVTRHRTLVTGPGESTGVPHYHYAKMAVNRRTGKLVIVSESAADQHTRSGLGAAPADANGAQIDTRPIPGSLESVSTGEVPGQAVRFKAVGGCPLE